MSALGTASWAMEPHAPEANEVGPRQTYDYKVVDGCHIKLDVYGASREVARPVVIWIHGGALIMGHRGGIAQGRNDLALLGALTGAGYVVVSIDYRLAPETKLPAIIEDVQDACRWIRDRGPNLFRIVPDGLAVMGASAGGYLALMTGFRVEPRPKTLVSFYGYGDIAGPWYSRPDPFYRSLPLISENAARKAVGSRVISEDSGKNDRSRFYLFCRQQGLWTKEVAGYDPAVEPRALDPFCPLRNVMNTFPPTLLIHGTKDTDVPLEQSELMDRELARKGIEHELITVQGGVHGLAGTEPAVLADINTRIVAFLSKQFGN
ncbi:alpha/beta hydrolase [Singulisphaera rosea]